MGRLHDLLVTFMLQSRERPSQRQVASRLGVAPSTIENWRHPRELIAKRHLVAIARLTGVSYEVVRDALLADIGYLHEDDGSTTRPDPARALSAAASAALAEARRAADAPTKTPETVSDCEPTGQNTA